jgi:hypothetical protein
MKYFILIIYTFIYFFSNAQSGYLGRYNSLSFSMGLTPNANQTHTIKDDKISVKNHILRKQYKLTYSVIVKKRSQLSLGFTQSTNYLNARSILRRDTDNYYGLTTPNYEDRILTHIQIEDIKLKRNEYSFAYTFFKNGNHAPIGKFIGIAINYGKSSISNTQSIIIGSRDERQKGILNTYSHNVLFTDSLQINSFSLDNLQLNTTFGRNIPLSKRITLGLSVTIPIYTAVKQYDKWNFPIPIFTFVDDGDYRDYLDYFKLQYVDSRSSVSVDNDITNSFRYMAYRYYKASNWLKFNVGISYYF